jgi:hypothetical protein
MAFRTDGNQRYSWIKNSQSLFVNRTRPRTFRCSTISCCLSAAFSASSRLLDLKAEAPRFKSSATIVAEVKRSCHRVKTNKVFSTHRWQKSSTTASGSSHARPRSTSGCTSALATPDASLSPDSRGHGTTARTHLYCRWRGGWSIGETDDFDGEGKSDILWRDTNTGATAIWFMNGTQPSPCKSFHSSRNAMPAPVKTMASVSINEMISVIVDMDSRPLIRFSGKELDGPT